MVFYLKMSQNINSTTRHIIIFQFFTNLLRTDNEAKSVKSIYN